MPRVVDGDNLLGSWPGRSRSDPERRELVLQVARAFRGEERRVVIVFDGPAPPAHHFGPDVQFSGAGRKADDVILDLLREAREPRGWTVVTNDRPLADQCRFLGCRVERCDTFRARLERETVSEKPEGERDIAYWLDLFGRE